MIQVYGYASLPSQGASLLHTFFERREPRDYDVVTDIQYSGICHWDIHQVNNKWTHQPFLWFQDKRS